MTKTNGSASKKRMKGQPPSASSPAKGTAKSSVPHPKEEGDEHGDTWQDVRVPTEHFEQVSLVNWCRARWPDLLIYAIPNGGFRMPQTRKHLKEEGVQPGIPDLHIPELNLYIEMKRTKGGSLSKVQKHIIAHLITIGCQVEVCLGFEEAKEVLQKACLQAGKAPGGASVYPPKEE